MTRQVHIRPALAGDLPALTGILSRAARANEGDREFLDAHPDVLAIDEARLPDFLVAEAGDGTCVGFVGTKDHPDSRREVTDLFVDPAHWRQGIGGSLLNSVVRETGPRPLIAVASPASVDFYIACGFHQNGTVRTENGPAPLLTRFPAEEAVS